MLDHHPTARCTTGEHYETDAPDTLDLAGRMGLAVNALTGVWNPAERWALGFVVDFSRRPANGARTLYCVWDSIVTRDEDEARVNLLLNRASPWVDVDSYLPAEGRVVLHIKDASKVSVRIPEWGNPWEVQGSVGGQRRRVRVEGRWVRMTRLKPGDQVTLTFSLPKRVVHRVIGEIPYKLVLRGSNVVSIDPKGVAFPLYEHQPARKLVRTTRFMPQVRQVVW